MPTTSLTCPRCRRPLPADRPFPAGSPLSCPSCAASFGPPAPPAAPSPALSGRTLALWVVGLGGVLLLLIAATVALAVLFREGKPSPTPVAEVVSPSAATLPSASPDSPAGPPAETPPASPRAPEPPAPPKANDPVGPRPQPMAPSPPPSKAAKDPPPPPKTWLPPEEQQKVDRAIDRGVLWLKRRQHDDGSWGSWQDDRNVFTVGLAALPALTMLECGVPADDPVVAKAVGYVRQAVPELSRTYDLAMSILLLDRLGDPEDRPRIRSMALRLIAGQTPGGGWHYVCPVLGEGDERELLERLEQTRPRTPAEWLALRPSASPPDRVPGRPTLDARRSPRGPDGLNSRVPPGPGDGGAGPSGKGMRPPDGGAAGKLPAVLRTVPALAPPAPSASLPARDNSDNSNTQFAALALWAAGRHDVPMERALALLEKRFRVSQTPGGRWGYCFHERNDSDRDVANRPAMTGAGLLGLAVGHGVTAAGLADGTRPAEDPAIERGLKALGQLVGEAKPRPKGMSRRGPPPKGVNYYLLWTVERVAVLFNLPTVGGKDWYAWGTDVLLHAQGEDGSWRNGDYPGSAPTHDTCFALLFLKRANLTQDLSSRLEFVIEVKERGDREGRRAGN